MQVHVRTLDGKTHTVGVEPTDTIESIKEKMQEKCGIDASRQRYLYAGRGVDHSRTFNDYGIAENDTLFMVVLHASVE